jgi:methylmalonyl-CoA/ethylmalonyl-CoA epimerase
MKPTRIEHIGIAVRDLEQSIRFYQEVLGLTCYAVEEVAGQNVRTAFFMVGETKIELLQSTDPEGAVAKFVEQRGEGVHHLAFAVPDVAEALGEVSAKQVPLIDRQPRPGAEGLQIAFLHPKGTGGVLMELCAKPDQK